MFESTRDQLSEFTDRSAEYAREHPWAVAGAGVCALLGGYLCTQGSKSYRKKPDTASLTGGGIERGKVKAVYDNYYDSYGKEAGAGITDRSRTTGKAYTLIAASYLASVTVLHLIAGSAYAAGFVEHMK